MISALEALDLPTAKLTPEEKTLADKLELQIETWVRKNMKLNGFDFKTNVVEKPVVAEVNRRLRAAGWETQWQPIIEPHPINHAAHIHTGFQLAAFPTNEVTISHLKKEGALVGN